MAESFLKGSSGAYYAASLYGYGEAGAQMFSGQAHASSSRVQRLARSEAYFRNRQHDDKRFSWSGCMLPSFEPGHQPPLSTAKIDYHVPLEQRRPCAPYRLSKFVVRSYTALLFGEGRFPEIRVVGDPDTQDFLDALARACDLAGTFEHARDVGGSSGTVGISWRFWEGRPRLQVHPGSTLHVQSWADREQLIPEVVTSCVQVDRDVYDEREGKVVTKRHWHRRDWTPTADVVFIDQPVDARDKEWVIDEPNTVEHGEGFCHFVWVANHRDYDGSGVDGEADYEGVTELCDALDVVFSATLYGGAKNIEPTLLLMLEPDLLAKIQKVHKGADRALPVGKGGGAEYLELSGSSIEVGIRLVDRARSAVLETAQVVAPDPDKVAAAGSSSVALKMLYAQQLAPAAVLRSRYGSAIKRLLGDMERSIRLHSPVDGDNGERVYPLAVEPTPGEQDAVAETAEEELFIELPPRVIEEQVKDPATGLPTGEKSVRVEPRQLGKGGEIELHWPDWFPLTADDRSKETTTLSTAAGGKPVLSHKSVVEKAAQLHGLDPAEEWREVAAQVQAEREAEAGMFPPASDVDASKGPQAGVADAAQATGQDVEVLPETVLNGAQVQAALAIVTAVAAGEMPRDAALGQLEVLFNLESGQALKILGSVGEAEVTPRTPTPP